MPPSLKGEETNTIDCTVKRRSPTLGGWVLSYTASVSTSNAAAWEPWQYVIKISMPYGLASSTANMGSRNLRYSIETSRRVAKQGDPLPVMRITFGYLRRNPSEQIRWKIASFSRIRTNAFSRFVISTLVIREVMRKPPIVTAASETTTVPRSVVSVRWTDSRTT